MNKNKQNRNTNQGVIRQKFFKLFGLDFGVETKKGAWEKKMFFFLPFYISPAGLIASSFFLIIILTFFFQREKKIILCVFFNCFGFCNIFI